MNSYIDLHLHTAFSDGTDTITELISNLKKSGINIFAVCDHDTVAGCSELLESVTEDMRFICGVELSARTEFKRCHILGMGIDIKNNEFLEIVAAAEKLRDDKLYSRLEHLKNVHNIIISSEDVMSLIEINSVGKPHIAKILVRDGYAANISEAIKNFLTFKGNNDRIDAEIAIKAIKAAGGIPVWAHPLGGEGEKRLTKDEFRKQLELLCDIGIEGLECYYSRYTSEEAKFLCEAACSSNLLISGGSDYHGSNKDIDLGQLSASGEIIDKSQLTVLSKLLNKAVL